MSVSRSSTYKKLCLEIKAVYDELVRGNIDDKDVCKKLRERLNLIGKIISGDNFDSPKERNSFLRFLLDVVGITSASGADAGKLKIKNRNIFGRKSVLLGEFNENENFISWGFSKLIQGWLASTEFSGIRDLRFEKKFENERCADFLPGNEIVECKRFHSRKSSVEDKEELIRKIIENFREAESQLNNTYKILEKEDCRKTAILDLSSYGTKKETKNIATNQVSWSGFEEKQIEKIAKVFRKQVGNHTVDQVVFCWNKLVQVNEQPKGFVQSSILVYERKKTALKDYGWTSELYNLTKNRREARVRLRAISEGEIATFFNNREDNSNFWTTGDWQSHD